MRGIIFVMPVWQVLVFGYAVTLDERNIATAVYDLDNSVASHELVARFQKSGYFDIVDHIDSEERARELLDRGGASAVLQMNRGFGNALRAGRIAELQLIVDATDSNTAGVVLDCSAKITKELSQKVLIKRFTRVKGSFGKPGRVELETRAWFNDNLESRNFYVPGVIAIVVMLITLY
jgi:ABC-2 type transport system permease protein